MSSTLEGIAAPIKRQPLVGNSHDFGQPTAEDCFRLIDKVLRCTRTTCMIRTGMLLFAIAIVSAQAGYACAAEAKPTPSKAKSPQESLATIKVRPGFKVELVAAEPLIDDPVAFDWGTDGRLWVVEMRDYPMGMDNKGKAGGR